MRAMFGTVGSVTSRLLPKRTPTWVPGRDTAAHRHPAPQPAGGDDGRPFAGERPEVVVVGGGIAGLAAAVALVERGVGVTLLEREPQLGGRVRSWPVDVPEFPASSEPGSGAESCFGQGPATMSRGFHAFFRQYYTLRALLRRTDPGLTHLTPVSDYPLVHVSGMRDSFSGIPRTPPLNMMTFVARSPSFTVSGLVKVDVGEALGLLDVDFPATFREYEGVSAAEVLDRLHFPDSARHLALEVFARSFFADAREFSGGELVAMFHAYFLGSAEGLLFDVPDDDYDTVLWAPLGRYLTERGATVRTGVAVDHLDDSGSGLEVSAGDETWKADAVVLATDQGALRWLVGEPGETRIGGSVLNDEGWRDRVRAGRNTPPFAVWRLWFDRPVAPGTVPFLGTAAFGALDNVSAVHLFEERAASWVRRTGGSVVELHAYALPAGYDEASLRADLRAQLARLHPELDGAGVVHEEWLVRQDCALVATRGWAERPGVVTPDPRIVLAGDGVRCELPVALMERAAVTGFQAANTLLAGWGRRGHDLWSVPMRGRHLKVVRPLRRALSRSG